MDNMSKRREGSVSLYDTSVNIWEESDKDPTFRDVYLAAISHLRSRGFRVVRDPQTKKNFPTLSKNHHHAQKGYLEVDLSLSGRHIGIEFFQNVVRDNPNGGKYDFDKYGKMPYLVKKSFLLESTHLINALMDTYGYSYGKGLSIIEGGWTIDRVIGAVQGINGALEPLKKFNDIWGSDRFKRDETGWPQDFEYQDYGRNKDRDGVLLENGMVRYFRGFDGYLRRGTVYTNMNSTWVVVYGPGKSDVAYRHGSEFFSLKPDEPLGRHMPKRVRISRVEKLKQKAIESEDYERAAILRDVLKGERLNS